ncbi:MAG: TonB-dependent receptor domain-containing protein [Polyangiales bacterium]
MTKSLAAPRDRTRRRHARWLVPIVVAGSLATILTTGHAYAEAPVLKPPVVRVHSEPTPPDDADARAMEATVRLELDIDATGKVTGARVSEGAGHGFDEAAVAAALKLEFDPATRDGKPIAARLHWRFHFDKRPDAATTTTTATTATTTTTTATTAPPAPKVGQLHLVARIVAPDAPIAGAKVEIKREGSAPTTPFFTDAEGALTLVDLAPGTYHLTVTAEGFESVAIDEEVFVGRSTDVVYRLAPAASADEIVIKGERKPREVTVRVLEQRELSRIPGTNGDALKAIQTMPGVARSPGLGSALIVRGSAPADTQVFIDGIPIPIVYHFGGISSVVPTEMLERLEFRPGNFGAEYGRAMGGVIDVRTSSAPADGQFHALAQADFIDSRFVAKGKIPLLEGWSFVAGARRSYVDVWLGPILSRSGGFSTAPVYYDWQLFAETHPTPKSRFRIGFFGSDDKLEVYRDTVNTRDPAEVGDLGLHTGFGRVMASFEDEISKRAHFFAVIAYGWDVQSFNAGSIGTDVTGHPIIGRSELSITLKKGYVLHVGVDTLYSSTTVSTTRPPPSIPGQPDAGTSGVLLSENDAPSFFLPAAYSEMEMQLSKRLRLVPSFRVDYDSATSKLNTAPRISGRYALQPGDDPLVLKGGAGVYYQPPQATEISPVFGTPGLLSNRSYHFAIGLEKTLEKSVEVSVEGFYKILEDLVVRAPSPTGGGNIETNLGTGSVMGAEVLIRIRPNDRMFGWLAYTLSRSTRVDLPGQAEHLFRYDQTHILTALASYRIGAGWEIGARFRIVSGNPYTPCLGGALDAATSSYSCLAGPTMSDRLPLFHQLDLRVDKHWYFNGYQISAYLDVYNAYDRGNAEGIAYNFDYSQHIYQTGLPIVPSLGLRGEL